MIILWLVRRIRAWRARGRSTQPSGAPTERGPGGGRRSEGPPSAIAKMSWHQFRYDLLTFLRNRQARFFTIVLPILFLVIFSSVFGNDTVKVAGGRIDESVYYVPAIMALAVIAAAFVNLVISVTAQRETGVLKRRRATPVPVGALIGGRALTSMVTALGIAAVLVAIGWIGYGAHVPSRTAPALVLAIVIGALSFGCLGFALTSVIRDQDAAQPVTQAVMLPLYFISGVFVASAVLPHWLVDVAGVFPVRHLASALLVAYNPHTRGAGVAGVDLLIVAAWGIGGLIVALRRFSWVPFSQ